MIKLTPKCTRVWRRPSFSTKLVSSSRSLIDSHYRELVRRNPPLSISQLTVRWSPSILMFSPFRNPLVDQRAQTRCDCESSVPECNQEWKWLLSSSPSSSMHHLFLSNMTWARRMRAGLGISYTRKDAPTHQRTPMKLRLPPPMRPRRRRSLKCQDRRNRKSPNPIRGRRKKDQLGSSDADGNFPTKPPDSCHWLLSGHIQTCGSDSTILLWVVNLSSGKFVVRMSLSRSRNEPYSLR